jgi:hypothetical protein
MKIFLNQNRIFFSSTLLFFLFFGGNAMAIEKAKYDVVASDPDFEIRRYDHQIVAETMVEGDFEKVGNEGFRRLYDYISGNNRKNQSIAMTAPVTQEGESVQIAMTAPVSQVKMDNKWRIIFMMPSEFSMDDLPDPLDPRVRLKREPGRLVAALKYSGTWSKSRFEEKKKILEDLLSKNGLKPAGEPIWARYDPPFMPWFLRRNEVLIPVAGVSNVD